MLGLWPCLAHCLHCQCLLPTAHARNDKFATIYVAVTKIGPAGWVAGWKMAADMAEQVKQCFLHVFHLVYVQKKAVFICVNI